MNTFGRKFLFIIRNRRAIHRLQKCSLTTAPLLFNQMYIFDRNAKRLQKERAALNPDVELYDYIKEEVGLRLADRILDIKRDFKLAADIGCNRGYVSKNVLADSVEHLLMCEYSSGMLQQAIAAPGLKHTKREMDEECVEFEENSLDLAISSLSLHWVNDLPLCFYSILRSLKPDGAFIGSMFGGDTLFELRVALQLAEQERNGGISPHISPFTQSLDIDALLNKAGFTMRAIDKDEIVVGYPSIFELMNDLKGMGENNAALNRPLRVNRDTLMAAAAIYKDLYGNEKGISATFEIIYFVGWKPADSQPKPLPRGSADMSLKDLGSVITGAKS